MVSIDSLKPSLGKEARTRQIKEARREQIEDSYGSQSPVLDGMECSDRVPSPDSLGKSCQLTASFLYLVPLYGVDSPCLPSLFIYIQSFTAAF